MEHITGETDHLQLQQNHHSLSLSRPGSVLSLMGGGGPLTALSPTKKRPGSNLWRSQSCMSDLDQEDVSQVTLLNKLITLIIV